MRRSATLAPPGGARTVGGALVLAGLTVLALVPGVLVALVDGGPSVFNDELIYWQDSAAVAGWSAYADPHYPPGYPLLLSLGVATADPFRAMLLLNAAASAAVVPAVWFLARVLGMRRAWIPALLAALLPMHGAFTGYLLSENLAVPLFVLCTALAIRGRPSDAVVLGLALGALHLTRFLMLPAVALLAATWLVRLLRSGADGPGPRLRGPAVRAGAAYLAVVVAWVSYGMLSGHGFAGLWGLSTVQDGAARAGSDRIGSSLTWATQYAGYLALAAPIPLALLLAWLLGARGWWAAIRAWTPRAAYASVTLLMVVGYLGLATLHSSGVEYNHPDPSHMQGRYLMHVVPLVVVAGCLALERVRADPRRPGAVVAATSGALVVAAAWGGWWVSFHGGPWSVPAWGAQLPFNAIDIFALDDWRLVTAVSVAVVAVLALARWSGVVPAAVVWALCSALVLSAGVATAVSAPTNGARERVVADAAAARGATGAPVSVWVSDHVLDTASVASSVTFWHGSSADVRVEAWDGTLDETVAAACVVDSGTSTELWVTNRTVTPRADHGDLRVGDAFSVVDVAPGCMDRVVADWLAATSG